MEQWRVFVGVELPEEVRAALGEVQRVLKSAGADASWMRPQGIHLTLKFIGNAPVGHVERLAEDLDRAAADSVVHEAQLVAELGAFPSVQRIRVVWAGLEEPSGELEALQKRVDENTSWWTPPDSRRYVPHLTLGRVKSGRNVAALGRLIREARLPAGLVVPVEEVVLFRSELRASGALHTPLHRARLTLL